MFLSTTSKRIKYIGIKLCEETEDMYSASYNTLMREIEDDANRGKDIPCSWIGRINIVIVTILPKAIYISIAVPVKVPMAFLQN